MHTRVNELLQLGVPTPLLRNPLLDSRDLCLSASDCEMWPAALVKYLQATVVVVVEKAAVVPGIWRGKARIET